MIIFILYSFCEMFILETAVFEDTYGILRLNASNNFQETRNDNHNHHDNNNDNNKHVKKLFLNCNVYAMFKYWENDPFEYIYFAFWKSNNAKLDY